MFFECQGQQHGKPGTGLAAELGCELKTRFNKQINTKLPTSIRTAYTCDFTQQRTASDLRLDYSLRASRGSNDEGRACLGLSGLEGATPKPPLQ